MFSFFTIQKHQVSLPIMKMESLYDYYIQHVFFFLHVTLNLIQHMLPQESVNANLFICSIIFISVFESEKSR